MLEQKIAALKKAPQHITSIVERLAPYVPVVLIIPEHILKIYDQCLYFAAGLNYYC